jgi:PAS domain S-box-containing protein
MQRRLPAIALAVGTLLAAALLSIYSQRSVNEQALSQFHESQLLLARHVAARIEAYLDGRSHDVRYLASLASLQRLDARAMPADVEAAFSPLERAFIKNIVVLDATGRVAYATAGDASGSDSIGSELDAWARTPANKGVIRLVVEASGEPVESTTWEDVKPPAPRFVLVTPLYRDPGADGMAGAAGAFSGVLRLTIDLERLAEETGARVAPEPDLHQNRIWVMDEGGTLLLHSEHPEMVLRNIRTTGEECRKCHASFDEVQEILTAKQGFLEYQVIGQPSKVAAFAPLAVAGVSWIAVVSHPRDAVADFMWATSIRTFGLFGVVGIVVGVAFLSVYRNSKQAIALAESAKHLQEERRLVAELQASEQRHRTLFDSSRDALMTLEPPSWLFTSCNAAALAMFGAKDETQFTSLGPLAMSPERQPDGRASAEKAPAMIETATRDGSASFEWTHQRADGAVFPARVLLSRMELAGKAFLLASVRDITERKQAEAEKARLEAQLRQGQKMESVGRLAGGVAHEFNNMLAVILGYTEMAMEQVDPAQPVHADLEEIRKAATHSADLTRQLLAYARKQIIAPRVLDLNETVAGSLNMLARLIGEDIRVSWQPAAALWPVRVDPGQVGQILTDLCLNARDAISGTGHLTIETGNTTVDETDCAGHPERAPGQYVVLAVSDDGCGMESGTLANLFEPFFTTKDVGQGAGLGLATVYGIVRQNAGFVAVSSEPGVGTTFRVHLPRHRGETV